MTGSVGDRLCIVNPRAGMRRPEFVRNRLGAHLGGNLEADVVFTEGPGHAAALAADSASYSTLAVFGGDGTLAEVVNAMDLKRQSLLPLPGGTGNGLARDVALGTLRQALRAARERSIRRLDLMEIRFTSHGTERQRLAISTAALGYVAEVVALANRFFKPLRTLCYPSAATLAVARQPLFHAAIGVDGDAPAETSFTNLMVHNTAHAGNLRPFPSALPDDGKLELLVAEASPASQFLHNVSVMSRSYRYESAQTQQIEGLSLKLYQGSRLMIDGEIWERVTQVDCRLRPSVLSCLCGSKVGASRGERSEQRRHAVGRPGAGADDANV